MYYQAPSRCSTWCSRIHHKKFSHPTRCRRLRIIVQSSHTCQQRKVARPSRTDARLIFMYDKADARQLWDALEAIDWDSILQGSLEEAVLGWTDSFLATCHAHVPHKLITINPSSKPWYNKHLKSLATWRDRLFRRSRGQPHDATIVSAFRKVRNLYVSELRAVEKRYFSRLGWKLSSGSLPVEVWWRYAKKACGWSSHTAFKRCLLMARLLQAPINKQQCWTRSLLSSAMLSLSLVNCEEEVTTCTMRPC